MEKRAYTIDLLRGLAIVGMVLSGQILWHAELPAWLFHAQVPPPHFRFDPSVPGITWVDLVFPFFLFSMGAAFPLALRKRLEVRGESVASVVMVVVRRWALLALFAIALANLRPGVLNALPAWGASLMQLAGWGCFCALFMRFERLTDRQNRLLCMAGCLGLVALLAAGRWIGGLPISVQRSDIIILVLANMALLGSLVWLATRKNVLARLGVLALLVALRLGSDVEGSWNEALWNWSPVPWLFRFDYLKYLCIIIPGTIAGEYIYNWMRSREDDVPQPSRSRELTVLVLLVGLLCVNMWGLFWRHLTVNLLASVVLCLLISCQLRRGTSSTSKLYRTLFGWGAFWLMLGLAFEAFEGGIRKDHATYSYFFVTSGLASFVLVAAGIAMRRLNMCFSVLVKCGQNPMVAYTAAGFIVMPLLTLLHLAPYLQAFAELHPWMGVVRGVVVTAVVMAITVFFTDRRLFWRT
ncbi:DUF5009 domain-containing protein [uncultured Alistipes sp.]|uniref:DUF5009 domain-containing protein n=1 Tax=uncultured Alistipes sp. TaxID=538949 RepID=UPI0025D7ADB3|nr:DUF5009 domain-containing protein [uncultured Alistipes sp.]